MNPIDHILQAKTPNELFGNGDAEARYKKLQRQVHPDLNQDRPGEATLAFVKLNEYYVKFTTGDTITFTTKKATWTLLGDVWKSSGVRYRAVKDAEDTWVAYVATTQASGPFTEGFRILEQLNSVLLEKDLENLTSHRYYFPRIKDRFKLGDQLREARAISAELPGTRWFPLSSWTSVDPRDIGWIARRGLMALDLIHENGYLHGSPHLEAFIIEPEQHGLMVKDWQYAVRRGDPLALFDARAKDLYPTWVKTTGATKTPDIDLMVFGGGFKELSHNSHAPYWLEDFFSAMVTKPQRTAKVALHELTSLMDSHWERKFHKMEYPF